MAKRPAPAPVRGIMASSNKSAFCGGLCQDFGRASVLGLIATIAFIIGLILGSYSHNYDVCDRMYDSTEDIMECVWILENGG